MSDAHVWIPAGVMAVLVLPFGALLVWEYWTGALAVESAEYPPAPEESR